MGNRQKIKAVTIIELVMVIVIVGILAGVSSMYIKETIDLWSFLTFRNEVVSGGRMALARMGREIRQIKDDLSVYTATASEFEFDDINSNRINYRLAGNNLMRNSDILVSGVNSFTFTYYNKDNQVITTPEVSPDQTDIYRIDITFQIQSGDQAKTLGLQIYPRNLGG